MTDETALLRGVVRGRIIELDQQLGLRDGPEVRVVVRSLRASEAPWPPGEGIRRSAGAWADDAEGLDHFLEWNREQRRVSRRAAEG